MEELNKNSESLLNHSKLLSIHLKYVRKCFLSPVQNVRLIKFRCQLHLMDFSRLGKMNKKKKTKNFPDFFFFLTKTVPRTKKNSKIMKREIFFSTKYCKYSINNAIFQQ